MSYRLDHPCTRRHLKWAIAHNMGEPFSILAILQLWDYSSFDSYSDLVLCFYIHVYIVEHRWFVFETGPSFMLLHIYCRTVCFRAGIRTCGDDSSVCTTHARCVLHYRKQVEARSVARRRVIRVTLVRTLGININKQAGMSSVFQNIYINSFIVTKNNVII